MPTSPRKMILIGLLAAIGVAAIAGVLAVLLSAQSVLLRVMWTGIATAITGGLLLPLTKLLDRPRARPGGLSFISFIVVSFIMAMAIVWLEPIMTGRMAESLGVSLAFVVLCGIAISIFVLLVTRDGHRLASWIGIAGTSAALVLFNVAIWLPGRFYSNDDWWASGWGAGCLGLVSAACLFGGAATRRWWAWLGVAAAVAATGIAMAEIWEGGMSEELFAVLTTTALVIAYANLIHLIKLTDGQRILRWASLACAVGTVLMIDAIVLFDRTIPEEASGRLAAAGGIVTACGTLAMLILAIFNRRGDADERALDPVFVTVICPRCDSSERLAVGPSQCSMCGLRIHIRVEEPRCPSCAYLLYKLESDVCPECGAAVRGGGGAPTTSAA